MLQIILTCGCGNTDQFAEDAFKILFPGTELPSIVHTMGIIREKDLRKVVNALVEGKEKYAYYITWNKEAINVWNLLTGVQMQ